MSASIAKAEKHVELGIKIKHLAESKGHAGQVYVATHAARRYAPTYRNTEQGSGEDFWSIRAWTPSSPQENLKDPDLLIIYGGRVKFFVEVKWGTVSGTDTDLKLPQEEAEKITRLLGARDVYCNVNGPTSEPKTLWQHKEYRIDESTQFVLVTDVPTRPRLLSLLDSWVGAGFRVTDIEKQVGRFPSFRAVLEEKT